MAREYKGSKGHTRRKRGTVQRWSDMLPEVHATHRHVLSAVVSGVTLGVYVTDGVKIALRPYANLDSYGVKRCGLSMTVTSGPHVILRRVDLVYDPFDDALGPEIYAVDYVTRGTIAARRDNVGTGVIW